MGSLRNGEAQGMKEILDQEAVEKILVGQTSALGRVVPYVHMFQAGLSPEGRPVGVILLLGPTGCGKALPKITGVLTPQGWRMIGELSVGDYVVGSEGRGVRVSGVYPQGTLTTVRLKFYDHSSVLCSPDHLWTIERRAHGKWRKKTITTGELRDRDRIPMLSAPVEFETRVPEYCYIPPYTLGYLIGNGSLGNKERRIGYSVSNGDFEHVSGKIQREGFTGRARQKSGCFYVDLGKQLVNELESLGLRCKSGDKHIPGVAKTSPVWYRKELLQGLMDSDGSVSITGNKISYSTTSLRLAKDVQELVEGLCGSASIRISVRVGKSDEYMVRLRLPKWLAPFSLERKANRVVPGRCYEPKRYVESVVEEGEDDCVCISVDAVDKLFVTEHCILTHNTRTVEALAQVLHKSDRSVLRVDCGEFQMEHEVCKLIGAPPGYLGHRETQPMLNQQKLNSVTSEGSNLSLVLFDEIEKAAGSLQRILLGVLDKGTLKLGDNTSVNFEKSLVFLTSNLGAREMKSGMSQEEIQRVGMAAVRGYFSPEFVNRLDEVIGYARLSPEALSAILDQQLAGLQAHINRRLGVRGFRLATTKAARNWLLVEGTSEEWGARELKRVILRNLTQPLARLVAGEAVEPGSRVVVDRGKVGLEIKTQEKVEAA